MEKVNKVKRKTFGFQKLLSAYSFLKTEELNKLFPGWEKEIVFKK